MTPFEAYKMLRAAFVNFHRELCSGKRTIRVQGRDVTPVIRILMNNAIDLSDYKIHEKDVEKAILVLTDAAGNFQEIRHVSDELEEALAQAFNGLSTLWKTNRKTYQELSKDIINIENVLEEHRVGERDLTDNEVQSYNDDLKALRDVLPKNEVYS
jgi:hypothetical protein